MTAVFDNDVDYPVELDKTKVNHWLKKLKEHVHSNAMDSTPEEMYTFFHSQKKLGKRYSKKWFEKQYEFIHNQFKIANV